MNFDFIGIVISSQERSPFDQKISIPRACCKSQPITMSYLWLDLVSSTTIDQEISLLGANSGRVKVMGILYLVRNVPPLVFQIVALLVCFKLKK